MRMDSTGQNVNYLFYGKLVVYLEPLSLLPNSLTMPVLLHLKPTYAGPCKHVISTAAISLAVEPPSWFRVEII